MTIDHQTDIGDPQNAITEGSLDQRDEKAVKDAKAHKPTLLTLPDKKLAKIMRTRWDRHERVWRRKRTDLKVRFLRFKGVQAAQVDPRDPSRVWLPSLRGHTMKSLPDVSQIERSVHRHIAQLTADEPVMEAVPRNSTDEDRDAAEAATFALQGEAERMRLVNKLRNVMEKAAIFRSGFWYFWWDEWDGQREPARKYIDGELVFVDEGGNPVATQEEAAMIKPGNLKCETYTPFHVRFSGGSYAHNAREVLLGDLVPLRDVMDRWGDKLAKATLEELTTGVPAHSELYFEDDQDVTFRYEDDWDGDGDDEILGLEAGALDEGEHSAILDRRVFVLKYFHKPTIQYKDGIEAISVGKHVVHKKGLRWGVIPVVQFKFLHAEDDELGIGLVDLLMGPQELISFVHGQVLRLLQSLRRRWFLPQGSQISAQSLLNPTQSVIQYNPAAGPPTPEQAPEVPNSLLTWLTKFEERYDDQSGIHDTMQGKHVPGVSSGRHAEALRSGDETLLGLSRTQIEEGLRAGFMVILAAIKREWVTERRVRYWGEDREYIDRHFMGAQFGDTADVILKKGTLLMLTPAQKTETIYGFAQIGLLDMQEARKLAPLVDSAGISVSEDPHYQSARRDIERFLNGPDEEQLAAYESMQMLISNATQQAQLMVQTGDPNALAMAEQAIGQVEQIQAQFNEENGWTLELWDRNPKTATVHYLEKTAALSKAKVQNFPRWWVDLFGGHAAECGMIAGAIAPPGMPMAPPEGGAPQGGAPQAPQPTGIPATGVAP